MIDATPATPLCKNCGQEFTAKGRKAAAYCPKCRAASAERHRIRRSRVKSRRKRQAARRRNGSMK